MDTLGDPYGNAVLALRAPAWLQGASGFIIDLDGTLLKENQVLDGADELLRALEGQFMIVSNNSTHTAQGMADKLRGLGLPVAAEQLILAGEQTVRFMARQYPRARIRLLGSPELHAYAADLGCLLVDDNPDYIVLGRDVRFDYATLQRVANDMVGGAGLVVTNPDGAHPSQHGGVVPETGALMKAVVACTGVEPLHIIGKPGSMLFSEALSRLDVCAAQALVIGDNALTDAAGAIRLGMRYLLVGTGPYADAANPAMLLRKLRRHGHDRLPAAVAGMMASSW